MPTGRGFGSAAGAPPRGYGRGVTPSFVWWVAVGAVELVLAILLLAYGYWWTIFGTVPATAVCAYFARREWGADLDRFALAAAAEDDAAEREAEPEGADGERADRDRLAPLRKALPASKGRLLLRRQRLSAPALADRASCTQTEVEIVEELGRLGHAMSV